MQTNHDRVQVEVVEGGLDASGMRIAIVVSRFNQFVTERLLDGAIGTLRKMGLDPAGLCVVWVPGAWELPQATAAVLEHGTWDAVVALGCLMRGDTVHFDLIAGEATRGLGAVGREHKTPVAFGVLTTDTLEQAIDRAGAKAGNKGSEAVMAAVELASLHRRLAERASSRKSESRARGRRR